MWMWKGNGNLDVNVKCEWKSIFYGDLNVHLVFFVEIWIHVFDLQENENFLVEIIGEVMANFS